MINVVPVSPRSKYLWLKILLATVAILSFSIVLIEERIWTWWQQDQQLCDAAVYAKQAPIFYQQNMYLDSYRACGNQTMLLYSGISKTPLWVAQYLSAKRQNSNPKLNLPNIANYHQAHVKDQHSENYAYANLLFAHPSHHAFQTWLQVPFQSLKQAQKWQQIDQSLASLSQHYYQDIYVITGTDYSTLPIEKTPEKVWLPRGLYKALYIPETGVMGAYYLDHQKADPQIEYMSICALEQKLSMQLFPQLGAEKKRDVYQLPMQADLDFDWQYAYWDSTSQCEAESLKAQVAQQKQASEFVATPWLERIKAKLLTWFFAVLQWLVAQLA